MKSQSTELAEEIKEILNNKLDKMVVKEPEVLIEIKDKGIEELIKVISDALDFNKRDFIKCIKDNDIERMKLILKHSKNEIANILNEDEYFATFCNVGGAEMRALIINALKDNTAELLVKALKADKCMDKVIENFIRLIIEKPNLYGKDSLITACNNKEAFSNFLTIRGENVIKYVLKTLGNNAKELVAKVCNEFLIPLIAGMSEGKVALIFSTLGDNAKECVTKACMESSDQSFNSLINSGIAQVNLLCKALGDNVKLLPSARRDALLKEETKVNTKSELDNHGYYDDMNEDVNILFIGECGDQDLG